MSKSEQTSKGRAWIAEVLRRNWDPVGADSRPELFTSFVTEIERLIGDGASARQLAEYLVRVETESLGFQDTHPKMLLRVARKLLRLNTTRSADDSAA